MEVPSAPPPAPPRRGAARNPGNRFERLRVDPDSGEAAGEAGPVPTRLLRDPSRSVIARNQSPDVGFDASVNPYRGCAHGCAYCYARPGHEYLGFSAGLDFETRILVKPRAPALLRRALDSPRWTPRVLALSGVTDPYQPAEKRLRITRGCLEVLLEFRHPVAIVTKGSLVARDTGLLGALAADGLASVTLSITTLDAALQRELEPRAASPAARLEAVARLAAAGVPVGVNVAPVIPGLTEHELPRILQAAAEAGAGHAAWLLLRLPHGVKDLFDDWLARHRPGARDKVLGRVRAMRGGRLDDPRFGARHRGSGVHARQIADLFELARRRHGLAARGPALRTDRFRRPRDAAQPGLPF